MQRRIFMGLLSRMGEDKGEGDMIVPKATVCNLPLLNGIAKQPRWASPSNFIPLIPTFSHPGEGTLFGLLKYPRVPR